MSVCIFSVCVVLYRKRSCDGLISSPTSPTGCVRINKLKRNEVFHGCPMLQSGNNRKNIETKMHAIISLKFTRLGFNVEHRFSGISRKPESLEFTEDV
jgi:hypothetical protein